MEAELREMEGIVFIVDARKSASLGAARSIGILLIVSTALPVPVRAQSVRYPATVVGHPEDSNARMVPYGDLSLTTKQGRGQLTHRINVAIDEVCPDPDSEGKIAAYDVKGCKDFAWMAAQSQIKNAVARAVAGDTSLSAAIEISAAARR